jgi:hypothetical protein
MNGKLMYAIVAAQFAIALGMWYLSLADPIKYQSAWAMLLGLELILTASIVLTGIRLFVGGGYGK